MAYQKIPDAYLLYNSFSTKKIAISVEIDGIDILSNTPLYTRVRYGDPIVYGQSGIVYGGLRKLPGVRDLLMLEGSNLTLNQKIEPEQGRSSISQLSFTFLDKDGYMTQVVSPGVLIDEILGKEVKVRLGFQELSYPDQYFTIFRGRISSISNETGRVVLQLSDPNIIRRQNVFFQSKTKTLGIARSSIPIFAFLDCGDVKVGTAGIIANAIFLPTGINLIEQYGLAKDMQITISGASNSANNGVFYIQDIKDYVTTDVNNVTTTEYNRIIIIYNPATHIVAERPTSALFNSPNANITKFDTAIPVISNSDFLKHRLGPNGAYDTSTVGLYIKIDNEYMSYSPTGFGSNTFTVVRGQRGTTADLHSIDAEVSQGLELFGHGIDLALKLMLSQNGSWQSGIAIDHILFTGDPVLGNQPNAIIIPTGKSATEDYGITIGTYLTISGSPVGANNGTFIVERFANLFGEPNRIIYVNGPLYLDSYTPAVFSLQSQYDTLPVGCSVGMSPKEVDVEGHENFKLVWLNSSENSYRLFITSEQQLKQFLEAEIYLPMAAYSLTRLGRCSMGITRPPIADQRLQVLDKNNIIEPINVKPVRALNNRKFFNRVDFFWDADDDQFFKSVVRTIDSDSLNKIGILSVLPIKSLGGRTDLAFSSVVLRRTFFLLSRYKNAAVILNMKVMYGVGTLLEAGDIVAVKDGGDLLIPNYETGEQFSGTKLYEVIGRTIDIKTGSVSLELLGGVSSKAEDKYATWGPSSLITSGSTTTILKIQDSFGAALGTEPLKWLDYVGEQITIRSMDWSTVYQRKLVSIDVVDPYLITLDTALPVVPFVGWVIEIPPYPNNVDTLDSSIYKQIHVFWNAQISVASGISQTQFTVSAPDALKFKLGNPVYIHSDDYSATSFGVETTVTNVAGSTITVNKALGFTPSASQKVELIGYPDGGQPYRWV
jgi:hypothetical protein